MPAWTSSHKTSSHKQDSKPSEKERKSREAEKKAKSEEEKEYAYASTEFNYVWRRVSLMASTLKRHEIKDKLFADKISPFRKALQAMWRIQAAHVEADKQTSEELEKDAQKAEEELEHIIKEVVKARVLLEPEQYGIPYHESIALNDFEPIVIRDTLRQKSVPNFTRALSYWEAAYERQRTIMAVYTQISKFIEEAIGLYEDMKDEERRNVRDVSTVEGRTQRLQELKGSCNILLNKEADTIKDAEDELWKIVHDMRCLEKAIESEQQKKERAKERKGEKAERQAQDKSRR